MLGNGSFSPLWDPSFWKLLRSVTSLTINTGVVTLVQVRDIMAQLPNLDNLVFSGFSQVYGRMFPGIGTVLKGRFCGRLLLNGPCARAGIISMLLEIPSGLHFSELEIHCARNGPHSSFIRLAEACGGTLVKLLHSVSSQCKFYPFPLSSLFECEILTLTQFPDCDSSERSFDFSKFPNIQEVMFGFTTFWMGGSFPWIPMALSTLRPATSPRLSVIKLYFHSLTGEPGQTLIPDLRRIADEITRIEREFEGAVNFTVAPDPGFRALFKTFDVRFSFVKWKKPCGHVDSSFFIPCRSFSTAFGETGDRYSRLCLVGHRPCFSTPLRGRVVWTPPCTLPIDRSARGS